MDVEIRKYDPSGSDRTQIQQVCCDCAFLGEPIDEVFQDRLWFANTMVTPYLILEPQHTWVAVADGRVIGYLTGSLTAAFSYLRAYMVTTGVLIELIPNYMVGKYESHPRSKRFAETVMRNALGEIPRHPDKAAHFHFNVAEAYRHRGLGTRLLCEFEQAVRATGSLSQYYAEVMSSPTIRPVAHFERLGYKIYDSVKTTIFEPEITDLNVLCVVRPLAGGSVAAER
jgi:GNAT superfamily N-acetyltransferase